MGNSRHQCGNLRTLWRSGRLLQPSNDLRWTVSAAIVPVAPRTARVIEDRLGVPVRVRFDFGEPLDSPGLCFREWRDGAVRPFAPPKPGETRDVPHQPGPTGW
jgi:hypothetical protein